MPSKGVKKDGAGVKVAAKKQTSSNYLATSKQNLKDIASECGHNLELQSMLLKTIRDFEAEQATGMSSGQTMADMASAQPLSRDQLSRGICPPLLDPLGS